MEYHLCRLSLVVLVVVIGTPLTFGVWTIEMGLTIPEPGAVYTCVGWIIFHGFSYVNFSFNSYWAKRRHIPFDNDACVWAALYAYELSGSYHDDASNEDKFLPQAFCDMHQQSNDVGLPFVTLGSLRKPCENWLFLYGYTNDVNINRDKALARNEDMDGFIHLWAAGYGQALAYQHFVRAEENMSPSYYCNEMGQIPALMTVFLSQLGTPITCPNWILLYGYTDNNMKFNYSKAFIDNQKPLAPYKIVKPWYVRKYANTLDTRGLREAPNPNYFCTLNGYHPNDRDYFIPTKLVPTL